MNKDLTGRVAVVTGAGSGIGQAIAADLAKAGASVLIVGRTEKTLRETAALHEKIAYMVMDINASANVTQLVTHVQEQYGRLDILVNNAGVAPVAPLGKIALSEYETTFLTNVRAVVDLTQQALPLLIASRGNVINISSTAAEKPIPNMSIYSASKAAMSALTHSWAREQAVNGIRFNNVVVGPIETPIYAKTALDDAGAQKHRDFVLSMIPLGHYGTPEDVAALVSFLASDAAGFITGGDFAVDGGVRA